MALYVCDFAICNIGMEVKEMKVEKMAVSCLFCFFNQVHIELFVSIIDLPLGLYTLIL